MEYKGYFGSVERSEEDNVFYGRIQNIEGLYLYEGKTTEELKQCFHEYVDAYLDDRRRFGFEIGKGI